MSHHEVVHRGTMLRIPLLGECRVSQLNLIAIAWHIIVVEHLIEQFLLTIVDEGIEKIAVAHVASSQTTAMSMNVGNEIL